MGLEYGPFRRDAACHLVPIPTVSPVPGERDPRAISAALRILLRVIRHHHRTGAHPGAALVCPQRARIENPSGPEGLSLVLRKDGSRAWM